MPRAAGAAGLPSREVSGAAQRKRESWRRRGWRAVLRARLALIDRPKYQRVVLERVCGLPVVVLPDVFNPKLLRSGEFLVRQLGDGALVPPGCRVLDLGCGSGAAGLVAARLGCRVVSVDINPSAVRCTRLNALLNDVDLDVRQGDLFEPVADERFDVVLFNPPFYRGSPVSALDCAWRSPDIAERFAAGLTAHLGLHALVVLSSDGEPDDFLRAFEDQQLKTRAVAERDLINETLRVYQVFRRC